MYQSLIFWHSIFRWIVLAGLLFSLIRAYFALHKKRLFSETDNAVRHWTATAAHIQLTIGIVLYFHSPAIKFFFANTKEAMSNFEIVFFSLIHSSLMLVAIIVLTIGSALAKRRLSDHEKFKTIFSWYLSALILILIAIPWPFSPFASRPFFR